MRSETVIELFSDIHCGLRPVNQRNRLRSAAMYRFRLPFMPGTRMSFIAIAACCLILAVAGTFVLSLTAGRPDNLGPTDGRLKSCPDSPNCVSTQASGQQHWIEPISYIGSPEEAMRDIISVVRSMSGSSIVEQSDLYLYVEFRSSVFRFVDDVEFLLEPETGRIHFRSASRVGYSDLSANRKRMEEFRRRFEYALAPETTRHAASAMHSQSRASLAAF